MAIVGRAAGWIGRAAEGASGLLVNKSTGGMSRLGKAGLVGAGVAGVASGLGDPDGPWRGSIFPNVQNAMFDDPNALQHLGSAQISTAIADSFRDDVSRPNDYYYGNGYNARARTGQPVSGDMVFGMYNLRR